MSSSKFNISSLIYVLLFIGMLLSGFLVYEHFSPEASKICSFSENLDCDIVNRSPYATADGIFYLLVIDFGLSLPLVDISGMNVVFEFILSNAFLGFFTLLFLLMLYRSYENKTGFLWILKEDILQWLKGITLFSVLYSAYLFLIQHFILKTYCVFCLSLDLIFIVLAIIIWKKP